MNRSFLFLCALIIAPLSTCAFAEAPDQLISITHPSIKWRLQFEMPNALEQYNNYKDGAGTYAVGQSSDGKLNFSMVLHRYPNSSDAKSCRDREMENIRANPKTTDLKLEPYEDRDASILKTSGEIRHEGRTYFAQHIHRFIFRDALCGKVHVSTIGSEPNNSDGLTKFAKSLLIVDSREEILRAFRVNARAALRIPMAANWGFQTSAPQAETGRTITIRTPDGSFQWMLTSFASPEGKPEMDDESLRKAVEASRDGVAAGSTQKQIELEKLSGSSIQGYYFFSTDKTLLGKPAVAGNWKHMRQGFVRIGTGSATFTIFSNDEKSQDALRA
jgi:hypothetical protein